MTLRSRLPSLFADACQRLSGTGGRGFGGKKCRHVAMMMLLENATRAIVAVSAIQPPYQKA